MPDKNVSLSDLTTDPIRGTIYGFDSDANQLAVTEVTGFISTQHTRFESIVEGIGSLAFDRTGQLYGIGGANHSGLYQINKSTGAAVEIGQLPNGFDSDACGCPYTIDFTKSIKPNKLIGCEQVTIRYEITNYAGIGQIGIGFTDPLPSPLTIHKIIPDKNSILKINDQGENDLVDISDWTLTLGANVVEVIVDVPTTDPQVLTSQAKLTGLPSALDATDKSDDPKTPEKPDPTTLTILGTEDIHLEDYVEYSCDQDSTFLTLPVEGSFLWSTGDTSTFIHAMEDGLYAVTVQNECYTIVDSIQLQRSTEPLSVDLGSDLTAQLGDLVTLTFASNSDAINQVQWSSNVPLNVDCVDCPQLSFEASTNTTIYLKVLDENLCEAFDSVKIAVDQTKRIFVANAFTPNGDGINDVLTIQGKAGTVGSFRVFDRWGNMVFERNGFPINDTSFGWDGSRATSGLYIWSAEVSFPDDTSEIYSGDVMVIF